MRLGTGNAIARGALCLLLACALLMELPPAAMGAPAGPTTPPGGRVAGETAPISLTSESAFVAAAATYGWPGNGSESNPYVVSGLEVNGTGSSYCLLLASITSLYIEIRDCHFFGTTVQSSDGLANAGVAVKSCRRITLRNDTFERHVRNGVSLYQSGVPVLNCTFAGGYQGIYVEGTADRISGNTFNGTSWSIMSVGYPTIEWNTFYGGGGVYVQKWTPRRVSNNTFSRLGYGLRIQDGPTGKYEHNTFSNCTVGIEVTAQGIPVAYNTVTDCTKGISLRASGARLAGNELVRAGITFDAMPLTEDVCRSYTIDDTNTVGGRPVLYQLDASDVEVRPDLYGEVVLVGCSDVLLTDSTMDSEFWLALLYCDVATVTGNDARAGAHTLWRTYYTSDVWVANNTLDGVDLRLTSADPLELSNNTIDDGSVYLDGEAAGTIANNTIASHGETALSVFVIMRGATTVRDNNITVEGAGLEDYTVTMAPYRDAITFEGNELWGAPVQDRWFHSTDMEGLLKFDGSNALNGRPVLYLDSQSDVTVSGDYAQVLAYNCSGVTVDGVSFGRGDGGVCAGRSRAVTVTRCAFEDLTRTAVDLLYTEGTEVVDNLIRGGGAQVHLLGCNNAGAQPYGNVTRNYLVDLAPDTAAILIDESRLHGLTENLISGIAGYGIYATSVSTAHADRNEVRDCTGRALVGGLAGARWDHNSFIDCPADFNYTLASSTTSATWDDGSEGNYWSNYERRYPSATNDGTVWDTPYQIYSAYADRYPLVHYTDRIPPRVELACNATALPRAAEPFEAFAIDNLGVTRYDWSFDGGATWSVDEGPEVDHSFDVPGNHTVTVRVRDAAGNTDTASRVIDVIDNVPPVADAGEDVTVLPGTEVALDGSGSTDDTGIASYNWTFEYDGAPVLLLGPFPKFTFGIMGEYNVTLNVTDLAGNWATDAVVVTVVDREPPAFGQNLTPAVVATGDNFAFQVYVSDDVAVAGVWVEYWYTYVYPEPGNISMAPASVDGRGNGLYAVHGIDVPPSIVYDILYFFAAVDGAGNWNVTGPCHIVVVDDDAPLITDDLSDAVACTGSGFRLALNTSDNIGLEGVFAEYWFGDDATGAINVSMELEIYFLPIGEIWTRPIGIPADQSGPLRYRFHVVDPSGNWNSSPVRSVDVVDTIPPVADAGGDVTVDQRQSVALDGSASSDNIGIASWTWTVLDADGPHPLAGRTQSYAFAEAGVFQVELNVTDAAGNWGRATINVTVRDTEPPVAEAGPDLEATEGDTVTLDGSASADNVGIVRWVWIAAMGGHVNNIPHLEGEVVNVTLTDISPYNFTLTVFDAAGNQASDVMGIHVHLPPLPEADAGPDLFIDMGDEVTLDGSNSTSPAPITSYLWTIRHEGEEVTREGAVVAYTFDLPGNYFVKLRVTNSLGYDDDDSLYVVANDTVPPVARIGHLGDVGADRRVVLSANASTDNVGIVNWTWTIRRGGDVVATLYGRALEYTLPAKGRYAVNLTVRDAKGNAASDTATVDVRGPGEWSPATMAVAIVAVAGILLAAVVLWRARAARGAEEGPEDVDDPGRKE